MSLSLKSFDRRPKTKEGSQNTTVHQPNGKSLPTLLKEKRT